MIPRHFYDFMTTRFGLGTYSEPSLHFTHSKICSYFICMSFLWFQAFLDVAFVVPTCHFPDLWLCLSGFIVIVGKNTSRTLLPSSLSLSPSIHALLAWMPGMKAGCSTCHVALLTEETRSKPTCPFALSPSFCTSSLLSTWLRRVAYFWHENTFNCITRPRKTHGSRMRARINIPHSSALTVTMDQESQIWPPSRCKHSFPMSKSRRYTPVLHIASV